ncbi:translation initiation factor [Candidatus Woesearchaeota archaeon]|nr:translation initiation factor [Candidatus Woesearchaeota archaeon]
MSEVCQDCGLPKDLCVCETIAKEQQKIEVTTEKRKFGKIYTIIKVQDTGSLDMGDLTKKLKAKFACGGTYKEGQIELQGNHKNNAKQALLGMGFSEETIEIK